MRTIQFREEGNYKGRNGYASLTGVEITSSNRNSRNTITIWARNKKGSTEACYMEIPVSGIMQMIDELVRELGYEPIPGAWLNDDDLRAVFHRFCAPDENVEGMSAKALLRIPGIYEILAEEFNDEVLDIWWGGVNG